MQEILVTLTVDQANRILEILAQAPYRNVVDLITLISQSPKQVKAEDTVE